MTFSASLPQKIITFLTSIATIAIPPVVTVYLVKNENPLVVVEEVSKSEKENNSEEELETKTVEKQSEQKSEENEQEDSEDTPNVEQQQKKEDKEKNTSGSISQSQTSEVSVNSGSSNDQISTKIKDSDSSPLQLPSVPATSKSKVIPSTVKLLAPIELNLDNFSTDDLIKSKDFLSTLIELVTKGFISSD